MLEDTKISRVGLGGWHLGSVDAAMATRIMHAAMDEGITFFDNAWDYHDGVSEERMGQALAGRRGKVFLMTKNCERDYEGSLRCLDESLRRLRTDYLDLWQFHEVVYDNDPAWIFERGGMLAALEARAAGKVRYIGFTGHKHPHILLDMLNRSTEWDAAMMPINVLDAHYRSFGHQLLPQCLARQVDAIGMKALAGGFPLGDLVTQAGLDAEECYRYALAQPTRTHVMGLTTVEQVQMASRLMREPPMNTEDCAAFAQRVRHIAGDGRYELFKSGQHHDGPYHRRQHGFALA